MNVVVSVVIPAYNAETFISRTLDSVRAQTFADLEIIVVDDGSTDGTGEVVSAHAARDPRIRVIRTPNRGVAHARNVGTAAAAGRYVAYVDADDLWHERKIAAQVAAMEAHADDPTWGAVYVLHFLIDEADRVFAEGNPDAVRGHILARHLVYKYVGNGSSLLVRRDVALEVGGFDPTFLERGIGGAEDLDFELKIAARWKIEAVDDRLVGYRIHRASMSSNAVRMTRALASTVETHIRSNDWLPVRARRMARAEAFKYTFEKLASTREYRALARALAAAVAADPPVAWRIGLVLSILLVRRTYRVARRSFRDTADASMGIRYPDICVSRPERRARADILGMFQRQYDYLAAVDMARPAFAKAGGASGPPPHPAPPARQDPVRRHVRSAAGET